MRTDNRYCGNLYAEPGGSMFCPQTAYQASVPAYRVTYMYKGLPMASDEYPSTNNYTFSVLFRPEELSAAARSGAPAAESFVIATSRDLVRETVIDQAHSTFCQGYYIDGSWTHTNLNCQDQIAYKVVTVPSPYIKVTITPASRIQAAALPSRK